MWNQLRPAAIIFLALTLVTGVIYPFVVTGIAQAVFPHQANGSLIRDNSTVIGSELIGQSFDTPNYFWGRLSATTPYPYNAEASNGSNLGPMNPALIEAVKARLDALRSADPGNSAPIPVDLVTSSGSGLDPEISRAAADYQIERVARARGLKVDDIRNLVSEHTLSRSLGFFGEPRVNVLELNRALASLNGSRSVP